MSDLIDDVEALPARSMVTIGYRRRGDGTAYAYFWAKLDLEHVYVSTKLFFHEGFSGDDAAEGVKQLLLADLRSTRRRSNAYELRGDIVRWKARAAAGIVNDDQALFDATYANLTETEEAAYVEGSRVRALLKSEQPNREGLTFVEWMCAAVPAKGENVPYASRMVDLRARYPFEVAAWLNGEDPTEWRAV